jgi:hypothetical protein
MALMPTEVLQITVFSFTSVCPATAQCGDSVRCFKLFVQQIFRVASLFC